MSICDYLGPIRNDDYLSDSEEEGYDVDTYSPPPTPQFVVRIKPEFQKNLSAANTLVISLVPFKNEDTQHKQVGVIYAPAAQQKPLPSTQQLLPLGWSDFNSQSPAAANSALAYILVHSDMVCVMASPTVPAELQHGWIRAVAEKLQPQRLVLVDTISSDANTDHSGVSVMLNPYRSPAVLASAMVVGMAAAVLNYAETYSKPIRHVRLTSRPDSSYLDAANIDGLFSQENGYPTTSSASSVDADMIHNNVSTSLYL